MAKHKSVYSFLIEHRELPLLAVLALLLAVVNVRVPGYLANSWLNVLKSCAAECSACCS